MTPAEFEIMIQEHWPLFLLLTAWSLVWKGFALWRAAQRQHSWWFVIMLLANTLGILELIYLFWIAPDKKEPAA